MVQTHCPLCDWPADVLRGTRVHSGGFCEAFPLPVSVKWVLPSWPFSYFPEVHSVLFLESSFLVGCSLGSGIDKILPRCTLRGIKINERSTHFCTKVTARLLPCPLSFCPAIFLSQFSFLSAVVSGQINTSTDLSGQ